MPLGLTKRGSAPGVVDDRAGIETITSYPGLHPDFISQPWRKAGTQTLSRSRGEKPAFLYGCEIKSGWRPGYEVIETTPRDVLMN